MIKIVDDLFSEEELNNIITDWTNIQTTQEANESTAYKKLTDDTVSSIENKMLKEAGNYFYMSDVVGYEVWIHIRESATNIGEHIDTPHFSMEGHRNRTPKLGDTWPVCSTILYVEVSDDLDGANLVLNTGFGTTQTIVPKSGRYVAFGPGIYHHTTNSTKGQRSSINVNPYTKFFDTKFTRLW